MLTRQRARTLVDSSTKTMYIRREITEETDLCDEIPLCESKTIKSDKSVPIKIEMNYENDEPQIDKADGGNLNPSVNQVTGDTEHQNMDKSDSRTIDVSSMDTESLDFVIVKQEFSDEDRQSSTGDPDGQENIPIEDNIIMKEEHKQTSLSCSRGEKPFVCKLCKTSFTEFQSLFRHLESHRNFSAVSLLRNVPKQKSVKRTFSKSSVDYVSRSQSRSTPPSHASLLENSPAQHASTTTSELAGDATLMTNCQTHCDNPGHHPSLRTDDDPVCDNESIFPSGFTSQLAQIVDKLHKRAFHCVQTDPTLSSASYESHPGIRMKKVFTCEICNRSFGRNYHYKRHMTIHSKPQTYQCSQCDKRFKRRSHFDRHRCIRPYRCQMWKTHGW